MHVPKVPTQLVVLDLDNLLSGSSEVYLINL